jgi:hypothetical protein
VHDKETVCAEISRLLDRPVRPTSRGGTITRPFLDDVADALGIDASGVDKVQLTRKLVEAVGETWDDQCASAHTPSGGGGNITLTALQRILRGVRARRGADPESLDEPVRPDSVSLWLAEYDAVQEELEIEGHLDVRSLDDARWRVFSSIVQRRGQALFRARLLEAYDGRCAISGTDAEAALEAAHVVPYLGPRTNVTSNGLLLRADIHTLFDLGLIGVHCLTRTVVISSELESTVYGSLHGSTLREPLATRDCLTEAVLLWRAEHIGPLTALG